MRKLEELEGRRSDSLEEIGEIWRCPPFLGGDWRDLKDERTDWLSISNRSMKPDPCDAGVTLMRDPCEIAKFFAGLSRFTRHKNRER